MNEGLKPCVNTMCPEFDKSVYLNCFDSGEYSITGCHKYITENLESTWDMWRRIYKLIKLMDNIEKRKGLLYRFNYIFSVDNTDNSVRKMLIGFEKELRDV